MFSQRNLKMQRETLVSKEAMVKQYSNLTEGSISGLEKAEAEVVSLKQELATSTQQRILAEEQVAELDEVLKGCTKRLRQAQEEQKLRMQDVLDKKLQEWSKMKAEMEGVEEDLKQRMLAAEAQSCAMAKSLEERAKAIVEWQEGKKKAEMEAGLLQIKLESQMTEMAALKYELRVLSKELEIRNQESECSRKAVDTAHKQHLDDVKKLTNLESECQRLRTLVRKRLPGPAAILQMKMELEKIEKGKRRRSLGTSNGTHSSSSKGTNAGENATSCKDMADKLLAMEEETKVLKETLAKKTAELHSARQMCARTATKLSIAEEQLDSLQGTPTSVRSTQTSALESFLWHSRAVDGANSEILDDEVSCAESWASALITELDHFKKEKQFMDSCGLNSMSDHLQNTLVKTSIDNTVMPKQASPLDTSSAQEDYVTLKTLASKDAQLQSANLMCKDALAKLALAEVKLGNTWISENPKSNVEESVHSVGEVHSIMSKLDRILDDMRIAVASVGDMTDDDNSNNGETSSSVRGQPRNIIAADASNDSVSLKEQVEMQAKEIHELHMQVSTLEAAKEELQKKSRSREDELNLIKPELENARMKIEELKALVLNLQSEKLKLLVDEEMKREKVEAALEAQQNEVSKFESSIASLTMELADKCKDHEAAVAKCEALDIKLQSYMGREHSMAAVCRFEEESDARARKEREVVAAKEKLKECQRTILVLGKQLTAFTSPASASCDSSIPLHYEPSDSSQDQEVDHTHKEQGHLHQQKPLPCNFVDPHFGSIHPPANPNSHVSDSAKSTQFNASSKPRRIHSDLSCRTGLVNHAQYSMAEHLQMDDGVSSFYDSLPESVVSSPSSQYTSPSDKFRMERHMNSQGGTGARISLAKSLECASVVNEKSGDKHKMMGHGAAKRAGHGTVSGNAIVVGATIKSGGGGGKANKTGGHGATKTVRHGDVSANVTVAGATTKNGDGGGKAKKSFCRFFGRSKKSLPNSP